MGEDSRMLRRVALSGRAGLPLGIATRNLQQSAVRARTWVNRAGPVSVRFASTATKESYYDLLGIAPSATEAEIKSAYKKKALQWHPDRNQDKKKSTEMFTKISEAYQVLMDAGKRRMYDDSLRTGRSFDQNQQNPFQGFHGGPQNYHDAERMFRDIFGPEIFKEFDKMMNDMQRGTFRGFGGFGGFDGAAGGMGSQTIVQQTMMRDDKGRLVQRTVTTTIHRDGKQTTTTVDRVVGGDENFQGNTNNSGFFNPFSRRSYSDIPSVSRGT
eukprot:c7228_g1_i3.p1 GENE.c7228_g1_i3~~c7228_g1_i3.p1  ORF type:complete len:270 (-),score=64.29 c7228_g1_i3:63-872(-)